jgi:hypothetical protein
VIQDQSTITDSKPPLLGPHIVVKCEIVGELLRVAVGIGIGARLGLRTNLTQVTDCMNLLYIWIRVKTSGLFVRYPTVVMQTSNAIIVMWS